MKNLNSKNADFENVSTDNLSFNSVNSDTPQSVNDVLAWNGSSWEVKAAADLGVGGGGGGAASSFVSNIPAGVESYAVTYGPFSSTPRIASSLEINGDGEIIPYTMSGVSETGYHVVFSEATANTNYNIHTVFGGESAGESGGGAGSSELVVTVSGGKFFIDGTQQLELSLQRGFSYRFDQSDSTNSSHPIKFSTLSDGTHNTPGGSEYTAGIVYSGTPGSAGAYTEVTLSQSSPNLYYYCANHSGMGGSALGEITLKANGNIGIGTTDPKSLLTVKAGNVSGAGTWEASALAIENPTNIGSYSQVSFGYTEGTTNAAAYLGFLSTNQGANGYGDLVFGTRSVNTDTAPTERMRIDSAGNVGIGTTSPGSYKLNITGGNLRTEGVVSIASSGANIVLVNSSTEEPYLKFDGRNSTNGLNWTFGIVDYNLSDEKNLLAVQRYNDANQLQDTPLVIDSAGNVGIGTTNPLSVLSVQDSSHGGSIQIGSSSGEDQYQYINFADSWQIGKNNLTAGSIGEPGSLYIYNIDQSTSDFCITSNGNVGIGLTDPSAFSAGADKLVLNTGTSGGMTIKSAATGYGAIFFADGIVGNEQYRGFLQYNHGNSPHPADSLVIGTAGSTKMTVLSGGNVGIGTASPATRLDVAADSSAPWAMQIERADNSGQNSGRVFFDSSAGAWALLNENGNFQLRWNGIPGSSSGTSKLEVVANANAWTSVSDEKLKENISEISNALDIIKDKRCTRFNYVDDSEKRKTVGFIAQDWVDDLPEIVNVSKGLDVDDENDTDEYFGLEYQGVIPVLTKAIQEQQQLIEDLKSRIETLES